MNLYTDTDNEVKKLVGLTVERAFITERADIIVLKTTDGKYYNISHPQDCCEDVYFAHVNSIDFLIGATIISVSVMEWKEITDRNELHHTDSWYLGSMGIEIDTNKGTVQLENRVEESGGGYGGELTVSEIRNGNERRIKEKLGCLYVENRCNTFWYKTKYVPIKDY